MVELGDENQPHVIRATLPRRTCFSRKMPGNSSQAQVIGANIDYVAVVTDAGPDFNIRRMERYFMLIGRSGAKAVVLVNKADLFPKEQSQQAAAEIAALWDGATVHVTSALNGDGLKVLKKYLKKGITMCVVGSSGVGKSTLVNQLYGEEWQWTSEVQRDHRQGPPHHHLPRARAAARHRHAHRQSRHAGNPDVDRRGDAARQFRRRGRR